MLTNPASLCTDNAAMIAWMGWELINSGLDVDISKEDIDKIVPHTKIPLGSYAEAQVNIKSRTLKKLRQHHEKQVNFDCQKF